jgi:adenine-specific DNA-methyltransferase
MQHSLTMALQEKRDFYKSEIDNIVAQAYNNEQKQLACDILDNATENNIDALYTFITQRVKLGFTFDAAPEVNHNCVALCKRNNKLSFGTLGNKHKMIIGENYDALKNLLVTYTKNGKGLIDVIYIDPPYNTERARDEGNNHKDKVEAKKFLYRDKFTRNGWLNMMKERLVMARKLLTDNGVIFVSIDDDEQAYLKVLMDEIFGENFMGTIIHQRAKGGGNNKILVKGHDYIHCFAKKEKIPLTKEKTGKIFEINGEQCIRNDDVVRKTFGKYEKGTERRCFYEELEKYHSKEKKREIDELVKNKELFLEKNDFGMHTIVKYTPIDKATSKLYSIIETTIRVLSEKGNDELTSLSITGFDYPKPVDLLKQLIFAASNTDSIILDFFAGSGTTGQAVMELNEEDGGNRKCILVANNENNIGKGIMYERIFRVVNGKGTKDEKFTWTYSKDKPYLVENSWDVFEIEYNELKIDDFDKAEKLLKQAEPEFKALNSEYENKGLDIYNQLASLNPYEKNGK